MRPAASARQGDRDDQTYAARFSMFYPSRALGWLDLTLRAGMVWNASGLVWLMGRALMGQPINIDIQGVKAPALAWSVALLIFGGGHWLIWQLWRVVTNAQAGNVFTADNVSRLRRVGGAMLLWALAQHLLPSFLKLVAGERVGFALSPLSLVFNWFTLALIFFLFAEVLRQGLRLREEQALTI